MVLCKAYLNGTSMSLSSKVIIVKIQNNNKDEISDKSLRKTNGDCWNTVSTVLSKRNCESIFVIRLRIESWIENRKRMHFLYKRGMTDDIALFRSEEKWKECSLCCCLYCNCSIEVIQCQIQIPNTQVS